MVNLYLNLPDAFLTPKQQCQSSDGNMLQLMFNDDIPIVL